MNTNSTATMMTMMMTPWLHFGGQDYLIFKAWQPMSNGAIAGACIALIAFSILDRWIAALRRQWEIYWGLRAHALIFKGQCGGQDVDDAAQKVISSGEIEEVVPSSKPIPNEVSSHPRVVPPFIPLHDTLRGILHSVQMIFSYTLMLAVMTFNASYVISIVLGLAIGEVLSGRIGRVTVDEFERLSYNK